MAVLRIRLEGDPVLRQVAKPVPRVTRRIRKLIHDMKETMYKANGVGLAAPQVGVSERVIVVDTGEGFLALVNPVIEYMEGTQVDVEGCLSIPGVLGYVERADRVVVSGLDEDGRSRRVEARGFMARALQHEIDHLDGILFTDKATMVWREESVDRVERPVEAAERLEQR
ncbi:MAG: peptide deformylase [Limnochordales bacterium]|nr:peptide deformylase [Limnochordales bacterium]